MPVTEATSVMFRQRLLLRYVKIKKIAIVALTPTLNLTQTLTQTLTLGLTLTLILTQTQNLTQTLMIIKTKKSKRANEHSLFAFSRYSLYGHYIM